MAELTPETLAEWRAHWTDLKERGGQDVIITPEFALALLDELKFATRKARAEGWNECREAMFVCECELGTHLDGPENPYE